MAHRSVWVRGNGEPVYSFSHQPWHRSCSPNATATGAESSPLLGKGKKDGSTRWVRDLTIAVVSLALIVATFFITIELMNYEYKRTTFEVYTGCIDDTTKAKLLAHGFDLDSEQMHAVYVVPSGSAPVKMAHDDTRVGVYTVSTWMSNNKWSFASKTNLLIEWPWVRCLTDSHTAHATLPAANIFVNLTKAFT